MFNIRLAERGDISTVLGLIQDLATFEQQSDAVILTQTELENAVFDKHPWVYIYVAEVDGRIVGMALYYYVFSTWKGRGLHLEDLVVNEEFRRLGVGRALMNQILKIAKSEKVERMSWEVLDWNEPAIAFYQSLGTSFYKEWWLCRLFREDLERIRL